MLTPFLDYLIDDFGIWQHSDGEKILVDEGYSLDDAARGLIACLALQKTNSAEVLLKYISNAHHENGFYGFATKERKFIDYPASEDATGQVVWAMGYASAHGFHEAEAKTLVKKLDTKINTLKHARGYAYTLLGTLYLDKELSSILATKLIKLFDGATDQWFWPESVITYGNGIIPYVLLRYASVIDDAATAQFALRILNFIQNKCRSDRILGPIGNEGWLRMEDALVPTFSQQPIDSAYMIWAWLAASQYFSNQEYYLRAQEWMAWFNGSNVLNAPMYNCETLEAYDGIDKKGINLHSGAESNICLLLSLYMLENKITL